MLPLYHQILLFYGGCQSEQLEGYFYNNSLERIGPFCEPVNISVSIFANQMLRGPSGKTCVSYIFHTNAAF